MNNESYEVDLGFIVTKAPFESTLGSGFLDLAKKTIDNGKTVSLFFISDGVWFAKKNQKNNAIKILKSLIEKGAKITVSKDNLEAAGIENNELIDGVTISELVMEKWKRVMTI